MNMKFILVSVLVLSALFAVGIFAMTKSSSVSPIASDVPKNAPQFAYAEISSGANLGPADFKGDYLLIDFWASWCPPCNAAVPQLKSAYEQYKDKGFEILGVSIDKDKSKWSKSVEQKKLPWKNVWTTDAGAKVSSLYNFSSIPYFVLLNKKGEIIAEGFSIRKLEGLLKENIK